MRRGLTAEINLGAAGHNLAAVRQFAPGLPVIAVVKADAYGHGASRIAALYESMGVHSLGVAFVSEAMELRESGINKSPILVLFDKTDEDMYFKHDLTPVIHDFKTAERFSNAALKKNTKINVHVKFDTGMGRMGAENPDEILRMLDLPGINIAGLMSHFSEADLKDNDFVNLQIDRFGDLRDKLNKKGIRPLCHMANSAAVVSCKNSHLDAVRPGLILYGVSPFDDNKIGDSLKPVMSVKAKVLSIRKIAKGRPVSYGRTFITKRDTTAAVIAAGYADGFSRAYSNRSCVLINGHKAPVMGRVCMDLTVVDITDAGHVEEQSFATLLGADGSERITALDAASDANTIPYEVLLWYGKNAAERVFVK